MYSSCKCCACGTNSHAMERQGYFYEIARWKEKKCESREVEQYEDRSAEKHKGIKTEDA